jgi:predicted lipid-binding transport protein (Tim44 family)
VPRRPAALAATLLVLALAPACGGDDQKEVRQAVRDFVRATDRKDAATFCGLVTREYIEQSTGASGDRADRACRQQLRTVRGLSLRLVRIGRVEVDGNRARATAVVGIQGRRQVRRFVLEKEDGDWRLAGGAER